MAADTPEKQQAGEGASEKNDGNPIVIVSVRQPGRDCARCKGMVFRRPGCVSRPVQQ